MSRRRKCDDLTIIIPAAGIGRRMKSYGPKALIELPASPARRPETILGRQLRILRTTFPRAEVIVVVGYDAERVIRILPSGIKVVENEMYMETNVVRSISMGLRVASHSNMLLVYGDLVFNRVAIGWVGSTGSSILVDSSGQMGADEVGLMVVGGRVTNFSYGLPIKWAQVAYFTGRELDLFRRAVSDAQRRRHFGFEAINAAIDEGGRFRAVEPLGMQIMEVDASRDIEAAGRITDASRPNWGKGEPSARGNWGKGIGDYANTL